MPRNYSMDKRVAAVEETRNRIIEATMKLHDEQGISATTMQEIAARAGVALGTVYRHFPTLDELVPACGGRIMELNPLPGPAVFVGVSATSERYRALVEALFAFYSRGERRLEIGFAEALALPVLGQMMDEIGAGVSHLVNFALEGSPEDVSRLGVALADFRTWQAFKRAGLSNEEATGMVSEIVGERLDRHPEEGANELNLSRLSPPPQKIH
jgi:AcrR family transcriptional regulator